MSQHNKKLKSYLKHCSDSFAAKKKGETLEIPHVMPWEVVKYIFMLKKNIHNYLSLT